MNRRTVFAEKIAFRLPTSLYVKLNAWAETEDRPLANLVYTIVKQAVVEHEQMLETAGTQEKLNREIPA